ncbi:hypothetical protein HDU98_008517 [Podochytrium sp. JEL0797]|nr:hypothetical protein HDU98_008517 [Podochytrium sp. JEL0797]
MSLVPSPLFTGTVHSQRTNCTPSALVDFLEFYYTPLALPCVPIPCDPGTGYAMECVSQANLYTYAHSVFGPTNQSYIQYNECYKNTVILYATNLCIYDPIDVNYYLYKNDSGGLSGLYYNDSRCEVLLPKERQDFAITVGECDDNESVNRVSTSAYLLPWQLVNGTNATDASGAVNGTEVGRAGMPGRVVGGVVGVVAGLVVGVLVGVWWWRVRRRAGKRLDQNLPDGSNGETAEFVMAGEGKGEIQALAEKGTTTGVSHKERLASSHSPASPSPVKKVRSGWWIHAQDQTEPTDSAKNKASVLSDHVLRHDKSEAADAVVAMRSTASVPLPLASGSCQEVNLASELEPLPEVGEPATMASPSRQEVLGETHSIALGSMNNPGVFYQSQGRYGEAEPLFLQCLKVNKQVLGETHPDALHSLQNLVAVYNSQGLYGDAEPLYVQCLKI